MRQLRDLMIIVVGIMAVAYAAFGLGITTKCQQVTVGQSLHELACQHRVGFVFKNWPIWEQK